MSDLVYKIGADITDLEKGVSNAETTIKSLGSAIDKNVTGTLKQSDAALGSFDSNLKEVNSNIQVVTKSVDEADKSFTDLGKSIGKNVTQAASQSSQSLKSIDNSVKGTANSLNTLKPAAVNGSFALSTLGGVARDLPFGFIAIQNNLPLVVDSFASLSKQAGGSLPALKSIGSALVGPAGLAFAFGAVTAGVTALIQKYGSLGEAFNQILGSSKALTEQQKTFNDETAKASANLVVEEAKIKTLTSALLSASTPRQTQIAYYNELKKISPDIVAGISLENLGTKEGNALLTANIALRNKLISFKIQEAGITAVLTKNAEDLAKARETERLATINLTSAQKDFQTNLNQAVNAPGAQAVTTYSNRVKDARASLNEATKAVNDLTIVQNNYLAQLNPITQEVAQINEVTRKQTESLKKQIEADKKATEETKKRTTSVKAFKYELQSLSDIKLTPQQLDIKNNIEQLQELANVVLNVAESDKKRLEALNQLKSIAPAIFNGLSIEKSGLDKVRTGIDVVNEGYLRELDYINKVNKARLTIVEPRVTPNLTPTPSSPFVIPEIPPSAAEALKLFAANANLAKIKIDELKKATNLQAAYNLISDTFFNPVQELFSNFIETGKLAFSDFAKSILKAINQIVAKIIATGIISLIANLLFPGAGAAGATLGEKVIGDIGKALGFSFGGKVAAPSFAGVGGGALNMGGQVNVVLRGSDLIGSINRTNATINRVG